LTRDIKMRPRDEKGKCRLTFEHLREFTKKRT